VLIILTCKNTKEMLSINVQCYELVCGSH